MAELEETEEILTKSDSEGEFLLDLYDTVCDTDDQIVTTPEQKKRKFGSSSDTWKDAGNFTPTVHCFDKIPSGPIKGSAASTELECFEVFFTEEIVKEIAEQINTYHTYITTQDATKNKSRLKRWRDTEYKEVYCFLALNLLMPQVKKASLNDYWSQEWLCSTPAFSQIMARDRFLLLMRLLHFTDNTVPQIHEDSIRKIRMIVDHLRMAFRESFLPYQNICIDESLLLFKGRIFSKLNRHRSGIKVYVMCDCKTGYVLDFVIYTGGTSEIAEFPIENLDKQAYIVLTFTSAYLNKGHTIYMDNRYSSPALFAYLFANKTNACGTVNAYRKGMPILSKKLQHGEIEGKSRENLLAIKWHDKRDANDVRMLTTMHSNHSNQMASVTKVENIVKPDCIRDYHRNMSAVDKSDMLLSSIEPVRNTLKWYKKTFFHLLDLAVLNASILHNHLTDQSKPIAKFQHNLVAQIIEKYHDPQERKRSGRRLEHADSPLRLSARHFPSFLPSTGSKTNPTKRCIVCSTKFLRRETRYICAPCNVSLCVVPCFEMFHTQKSY